MANNTIPIKIPNGDIITSTHIELITQKNLPDKARKAHIFQAFKKPSSPLAPSVTITVLKYLMQKGSQYMTKQQEIYSCRATDTL